MAEENLQFVITGDGSKTIFNQAIGENYHSKHGALQESRHVFLKSGLEFFLDGKKESPVSVLEVGFGTGLNFLLSAEYCTKQAINLSYTGIEAFPLPQDIIATTGYDCYMEGEIFENFLSQYPASLNQRIQLNEFVNLEVIHCKLLDFAASNLFDVLYFDAFAAVHQPEMWTAESISHCCSFLKPGGVFVTYAITGNLKRIMKSLDFSIEKAPGAPGKREMLRAVKNFK